MSETFPDPDFPPEDPVPPEPDPVEPGEEQPVVDGWTDAPVSGDRVNVFDAPIVAGDPDGARVEMTSDGLHAYDATGAETAAIQGEGGEFVGGSFRTSDTLPGQVVMSDTAANGGPGIEITPVNATGYASFPHISPSFGGVNVHGGESLAGNSSAMYANPAKAGVLTLGSDGAQSEVSASPAVVSMSRTLTDGTGGEVELLPGIIRLSYRFGGDTKTLAIDPTGIWVRADGKSYNLEETAQDSGWQAIALASGITGAGSPAWRNKGGMIYFRGTATMAWTAGWNTVATNMPAEMRPAVRVIQNAPSQSELGLLWRMGSDGLLEFYKPSNGTRTGEFSGLFYPLG